MLRRRERKCSSVSPQGKVCLDRNHLWKRFADFHGKVQQTSSIPSHWRARQCKSTCCNAPFTAQTPSRTCMLAGHDMAWCRCPVRVISMSKCVVVYISPHVINSNGEKKVWRADADAPSCVAPHLVRMAAPVNQTAAVVRKPPRPVNLHDSLSSLSLNYGAGFIPQLICTWIQLVTYSSSQQSVHHSPSAGGEGGLLQILNHIHIWWLIFFTGWSKQTDVLSLLDYVKLQNKLVLWL